MRRLVFRRLLPLAAVIVLAVVFRHEVARAAAGLLHLHPVVLLAFPLFWLWNHVAAFGWRSLLAAAAPGHPPETALRLSLLRLQSQSVNLLLPALGGLGGGAIRIGLTRRVGLPQAAGAAILDDLAGGVAGLLFVAVGLALVPGQLLGVPHALLAGVAAAVAIVLSVGIVVLAPALAARLRSDRPLAGALRLLAERRHRLAPAFAVSVAWHLVERVLTAGEIYLAFLALGLGAGQVGGALFVHAVSVAVALALFFIPGQPGAAEAAITAACVAIGLDPATGLTVAFVRRARQLIVAGLGLFSLALTGDGRAAAPVTEKGAGP
jgi:hypothetical protein